ncbi:MAG: hypothetical protein ABI600_21325 [Luteolibacter sp.]
MALLQRAFKFSSIGAVILGAIAVFQNFLHWPVPVSIDVVLLKFLPTILPATAAWCLSMMALFEYKRRAGLYLQLVERLKKKRTELASAKCRVTASNIICSCERLLLTELWEWSDTGGKRR